MDITQQGPDAALKLASKSPEVLGSLQLENVVKDKLANARSAATDHELGALKERKTRLLQDIGTLEDVQEQLIAEVGLYYQLARWSQSAC